MAGAIGHAVARFAGANPGHKLKQDLQRIKSLVETGVSPSHAAQPTSDVE
ncbi:hypothetical protein [Jiangella asiatica]|nr:hypothetical protein [Jiangella asiatica]